MASIFKEINNSFTLTDDESRLSALRKINNYIKSGEWEKKKNGSKPVLTVLGMKQSEACNKLNITEGGYKVMMKRASDQIKEIIGEDTIHDIVYGTSEEFQNALIRFNIGIKKMLPETYINTDTYNSIDKEYEKDYNIGDLQQEIEFLKKNTKGYMEEELRSYDKDKLGYIISILASNENRYKSVKAELFKQIVMSNKTNNKYLQKN